jgi:formate C-acetyltransferase
VAGFKPGLWQKEISVRDFIQHNMEPYEGDESFLSPATRRTQNLWSRLNALFVEERKKGVLDVSQISSSITAHGPGYIDRENEIIVGLQTEAPLKRAIMPNGGFRMVASALKTYGYEPDPHVVEAFTKYRKTHNDAVFDAYTADIRRCRSSQILTGLPDAYGRGRIIGDYRRVALYGVSRLIERKQEEKRGLDSAMSTDDIIRDREELSEQIRALKELQQMGSSYGFDISGPAGNASQAVQWLYFGYLAAVKEQNGAAMSLGRTSTFLDIYFERDLAAGAMTEEQAQEIIDDFVIKLRIVRFLRTPEYFRVRRMPRSASCPGSHQQGHSVRMTSLDSRRSARSYLLLGIEIGVSLAVTVCVQHQRCPTLRLLCIVRLVPHPRVQPSHERLRHPRCWSITYCSHPRRTPNDAY